MQKQKRKGPTSFNPKDFPSQYLYEKSFLNCSLYDNVININNKNIYKYIIFVMEYNDDSALHPLDPNYMRWDLTLWMTRVRELRKWRPLLQQKHIQLMRRGPNAQEDLVYYMLNIPDWHWGMYWEGHFFQMVHSY